MANYCFEESGQVLKSLKTSAEGLTEAEAAERVKLYGANKLQTQKNAGIIKLFFSQFRDFMTILLIAAGVVSGIIAFISKNKDDLTDTVIILAIILLNAIVGTVQQFRADRAIENLKKLSANFCKVRRDNKVVVTASENLTVGDIVLLEEGDVVPADCRVIISNGLKCDESALTGESVSVEKSAARIHGNKVALGNMTNTLFGSTYVVHGNGEAAVTAVGMNTEMGKIAAMLQGEKQSKTPLERSLDKLGKFISAFVLAVTAVIFVVGIFVRPDGILKNFMTSVAIAVAAIPEGLPAVVTIIMAMGVQRMSKKGVIIRKLQSVETLGGCSVICSDKTGTLTMNKMRVVETFCVDGESSSKHISGVTEKMLQCMTVCSSVKKSAKGLVGDPTEVALTAFADGNGYVCEFKKTGELPFTSERKMMTVGCRLENGNYSFTKGAPDILIEQCSRYLSAEGVKPLTAEVKGKIIAENDRMSDEALRVLGFAYAEGGGKLKESGLIFIGLCGMADSLKEGVAEAVAECRSAGIDTVMITGDHVRTAFAIAKKLNIATDVSEVITGGELDSLGKKERDEAIARCRVFARVSPKHKKIIVKALQKRGKVVAMTGDGINDSPAIKSADIGISMGQSGTDVTKSASDMVIVDDNFTTIVSAVREGRRISANIRKTIQFFLSTNLAEVLAILFASLLLFKHNFLTSTQLLWLNLITDSFPVLALGMEKEDGDSMKQPPERAEKSLFSKTSVSTVAVFGLYMTAVTLGVFVAGVYLWDNAVASTMTFMTISFLELFQAFNIRSERQSVFKHGIFSNKVLIATVLAGVALNVLLCVTPLAGAFSLVKLNAVQWVTVFALSISVIPVGELFKLFLRIATKRRRRR